MANPSVSFVCEDTILVSYPKSGRTWLRMMLAKILKDTGMDTNKNEMILCVHKNYDDLIRIHGNRKKIIFLIRDPGDIVVSQYRELESNNLFSGPKPTISRFIRGVYIKSGSRGTGGVPASKDGVRRFGIHEIINYMNEWFSEFRYIKDYKIITYEEMKENTHSVLNEVIQFVGYKCDKKHIDAAIEYGSFSNMKMIEQGEIDKNCLRIDLKSMIPKAKDDPNLLRGYKGNFGKGKKASRIRKGKIGSYREELHNVDVSYIDAIKKAYLRLPLTITTRGITY